METNTPKYWLSLEQWRQDPEFLEMAEKEFLSSPLQSNDGEGGWARREFLKLMGASLALTSFGCMRRPAQLIVPYAKKPAEVVHGVSNYYASSFVDGDETFGIVVTTREGRPIKIEGNPEHPVNRGGMSGRAHAHILSLYDPDRLTGPRKNLLNEKKSNRETVTVTYEAMDGEIIEHLKKGSVGVLTSPGYSPSTTALLRDFASTYGAKLYSWSPLAFDDANLQYRFEKARMVVAVGNDFLGVGPMATANHRSFAKARKPGKDMCKLVVFESLMSLTGSNADERYRIPGEGEATVLMALVQALAGKSGRLADGSVQTALKNYAGAIGELGLPAGTVEKVADQLWQNRGACMVLAGGWAQSATSKTARAAAQLLNSVLDGDGVTIGRVRGENPNDLASLIDDLDKGRVKTLIIHGGNPGYAAVATGVVEAIKKASAVIYTGDRIDETGLVADYLVPDHHSLENWGDMEAVPGVYTIQQPTIRPLYETRAFQDSLLIWMKGGKAPARASDAATWYDYLRSHWRTVVYGGNRGRSPADKGFDQFWETVLQAGVFNTAGERGLSAVGAGSTAALADAKPVKPAGYTLSLYATVGLRDGTLANVPWLQEFPDPVTKICWDNYLTVSPATAAKEKLHQGDVVKVSNGSTELEVPVHIQPGQADGMFGLAVGYGRIAAGKVANHVGQNAYRLMRWEGGQALASGIEVTIKKTGKHYDLANTQGHHSMEGRQIVVEATLAQFTENPGANIHRHKIFSMWDEHKYPNNKWGMVIDLNSCTGCGSCVIACQSENNIPTVGKRHVLMGREMHWLRIDRYFVGEADDPAVVHQPVPCMHCDNAPCETVCPVIATVHSDEGTNDMIYNRCVGTRYCSNNCPYKVRRFNYFNFAKPVPKPMNYAMNPDVTVRARGVMEKCTFCIHRIRTVKSDAKLANQQLKDGDVKTACQQSCPADAIVFGDLNDSESQVRKLFDQQNSYSLLEELNTQTAVRYQSKIRNTEVLKGGHGKSHDSSHGEGKHS